MGLIARTLEPDRLVELGFRPSEILLDMLTTLGSHLARAHPVARLALILLVQTTARRPQQVRGPFYFYVASRARSILGPFNHNEKINEPHLLLTTKQQRKNKQTNEIDQF